MPREKGKRWKIKIETQLHPCDCSQRKTRLHPDMLIADLDLVCLHALLSLHGFKGDRLSFFERPEAAPLNCSKVHKQVGPRLWGYEPIPLLLVEPLDHSVLSLAHGDGRWSAERKIC
ncbi:hypothetical protein J3458_007105 [Metarhizium acridum]|uniref:uncharacterized protein n=1 Tax=Metarhizium acridum TaxID=92637 RepID=UPI001C6C77EA|nr:hypothetical protein J3458_007105 [Metarhizium acridum]